MKIYLTNLGKYNEGILQGEWVSLPVSDDELDAVKERIGINEYYEEWFITDYETEIPGFQISEYADLDELNDLAEQLEDLDDEQLEIVCAYMENGSDLQYAIDHKDDAIICIGVCNDMEDVAYAYAEECGLLDGVPDHLRCYFDYAAFGRDLGI